APPGPEPDCADCGTVYLGLTDAEGDFMQYELDVLSLSLTRADGLVVETLPLATRVDFAQYVDLTEFVTAATVPPGVYVSSTITVDYDGATVLVEQDGNAVAADVRDGDGLPPGLVTAEVEMIGARALRVAPGLPSWITLDFDLEATNSVDTTQSPPLVVAEPVLIADPDLFDEKERRARGPLLDVDLADDSYTIALRPFRRLDGDFGRLRIVTDADTRFEVDGQPYPSDEGLRALGASGPGTPTLTLGVMERNRRIFRAVEVFAGDSVPGTQYDAARGVVLSREDGQLTLHGVVVERIGGGVGIYRDRVSVTLTPETRVYKHRGSDQALDIDAISPGQRLRVLGHLTEPAEGPLTIEAKIARMLFSTAAGTVNQSQPEYLTMDLQRMSRRNISLFDFSGTGISPDFDADPTDYEVDTGTLDTTALTPGAPVIVEGFPRSFGTAPEDFDARTLADFGQARARLGFGWIPPGSPNPFLRIDEMGLVIDGQDPTLGERHHVLRAGIVTDALAAGIPPTLLPRGEGVGLYALARAGALPRGVAVYYD
ncbi:MAG: metallophosphoesterase, partial [Gammaproteobacteria bacterium]